MTINITYQGKATPDFEHTQVEYRRHMTVDAVAKSYLLTVIDYSKKYFWDIYLC